MQYRQYDYSCSDNLLGTNIKHIKIQNNTQIYKIRQPTKQENVALTTSADKGDCSDIHSRKYQKVK